TRLRAEEGLILHAHLVLGGHHHGRLVPQPLQHLTLTFGGPGRIGKGTGTDRLMTQQIPSRVVLGSVGERPRLVQRRTVGVQGGPTRITDRLQHRIIHPDTFHGPTRSLRVIGGHHGHGLPLVPHLVDGQHRLIPVLQPVAFLPGHVLVGEDRVHTGNLQRLGDIDAPNPCVRMRTAKGRPPQHVFHPHVRRVRELPGDLRNPVRSARGRSHPVPIGTDQIPHTGRVHHQRFTSCSNFRCAARPRADAVSTGNVRNSPRSTTPCPPTQSRSRGAPPPRTSPTTGSSITSWPNPSTRHRAMSASLPTVSEPNSPSRPNSRAPPSVAISRACRAPTACGPLRARAINSAWCISPTSGVNSLEAGPSTPSPTRTPASNSSVTRQIPAPRRPLEVGQCATPVLVAAIRPIPSSDRCTACANHTSSPSQPSSSAYSTGVHPNSARHCSSSSTVSAR